MKAAPPPPTPPRFVKRDSTEFQVEELQESMQCLSNCPANKNYLKYLLKEINSEPFPAPFNLKLFTQGLPSDAPRRPTLILTSSLAAAAYLRLPARETAARRARRGFCSRIPVGAPDRR